MKSSDKSIYRYLLASDGVNQLKRSPLSLDPTTVKMDGRTRHDILRFLQALSTQIRFFDLNDQPNGDWHVFFEALSSGGKVQEEAQLNRLLLSRADWSPHLALLMAFLHVYSYAQRDLNTLSSRRLNFYYEDVLRLQRRAAVADRVHVLFELSKNAPPQLLQKGTLLKAGKTAGGAMLQYALEDDYVINHAQVAALKSSYVDQHPSGNRIIFKSEDATLLRNGSSSWRPFGAPQLNRTEGLFPMEMVGIGCAVASPNFFLAEGRRVVTVTMHLKSRTQPLTDDLVVQSALDIKMTGEEGWITPDSILEAKLKPLDESIVEDTDTPEETAAPSQREFNTLFTVTVLVTESLPAISAYRQDVHDIQVQTAWPVWSMRLKPESYLIETFSAYTVSEVQVSVDVKGLRNLLLQNDSSLQSPNAPVLPFGTQPHIGANFYMGSPEAFQKSIKSLAVSLQWQDAPSAMREHYAAYDNPYIDNSDFTTDIHMLAGKKWVKLTTQQQPLFENSNAAAPRRIAVSASSVEEKLAYTPYKRQPYLPAAASFTQDIQQGFLKLVLTAPTKADVENSPNYAPFEAFGHKTFPAVYARHALAISQGEEDVEIPQPPYTPTLSSVALDYTASDTFRPDQPNHIDQFFLLDVFGSVEAQQLDAVTLIPSHTPQAALYLGLEKATSAQLLSLLVQVEEGSVPGVELLGSEEIVWSYLAGGKWQQISRADVLEDSTQGFQVPGLVRLILGADATVAHTLMPPDLHWIRASVASKADGASSILALNTQAAAARLHIPEGFGQQYDDHLATPLVANQVTALDKKIASVKKVSQPYPSFGGRPSETDSDYYRRVHERLRHRNRSVTGWDYERMVLEAFPQLFKVKCLPHADAANELAPGNVKLVVVPDWRKQPTGNPLKPKVNGAFLKTVEHYLEGNQTATFTDVHVANPVYETLLVDSSVLFRSGYDPGFHALLLEEEIKKFLSPWAYEEGEDIVFDGKISASEILAFIEGREYVDHVTDFELYHRHRGMLGGGIGDTQIALDFVIGDSPEPTINTSGTGKIIGIDFVIGVPVATATTTRPDAILVSNDHHRIGVLAADQKVCEGVQVIGIGQMVIGLDFIVIT